MSYLSVRRKTNAELGEESTATRKKKKETMGTFLQQEKTLQTSSQL
jgi:hypothetical protein